jgi:hypothetical protein
MNPSRLEKLLVHLKEDRKPDYIQYVCSIEEITAEMPMCEATSQQKSRAYAALRHRRERYAGLRTHDDAPWMPE